MTPPPPPDIKSSNALANFGGYALAPQRQQVPAGASAQPVMPAPSHQQTVAALRHFRALKRELLGLLKNPDLGKSNMRSKIIDGATSLVAGGIVKPGDAVTQLATVPERPYDQKKWVEAQFAQAVAGANNILDHHRIANAGMPETSDNGDPDDHMDHIANLTSQYRGVANGR